MRILVINPGSTSTKVSIFDDKTEVFEESLFHDADILLQYPHVNDQVPFRKQVILDMLKRRDIDPHTIDIYMGRGGGAYPQPSGVTLIDDRLYQDTMNCVGGSEHSSILGVLLAYQLCKEFGGQMLTMDPTNVDEFSDLARMTGIKGIYRNAQNHALNQRAVAMAEAERLGRKYEDCNFIVAHIDGGVTINAHEHGKMVDGGIGAGGDGAYAPTRIGSIPILPLLDYLKDPSHTLDEIRLMCSRAGGFVSHFGTSDSNKVHQMVEEGDHRAVLVWNGMIYNICKMIGSMSTVLSGKVDRIILTGGLLRFDDIVEGIRERCEWIAPISLYPGELEQEALAYAALRVARGEETPNVYAGKPVWDGFDFDKE